ncbi:hypothetical protein LTR05_007034 [Lithohypha guttulata]|uniref:Zn(2)-C6 fungal-type domain-containing protein n=1 Tax=Lithohypha guttulata TaxID=1690604 RepID=A0AAN7SWX6_9EURO|nr:hypothetical protein LTR05_007034 [Lithohypha guttulata]
MDGFTYDMNNYPDATPGDSNPIFNAYDASGNIIPQVLPPGNYFDVNGDGLDDNDPKRRRIARACDMCRKKKIKCDGRLPKCGHCTNYKTECIFTHIEKKRNPPKGAKYIEGLENRLGRMEQLLKISGLITDEEAGRSDLGAIERRLAEKKSQAVKPSSPRQIHDTATPSSQQQDSRIGTPQHTVATPQDSVTSPSSNSPKTADVESISDMMCSLVTNGSGETRYIGSSSAFSIFSQKGIEWVNEKTGDNSFQETIQNAVNEEDEKKWMYWKPEIFGDLFMRRIFRPLPPRDEAMSLFKDYFENFNCMFPLFHEPTFMHLAEKQYTNDPYQSSSWWACMNIALAIAYRLRVMSQVVPQEDDQKAWLYLKNALAVLTELLMANADLLAVQALVGCAFFMCGTANPQPSFFLISAALRLSHSIGLHKRGASFNLNPIEAEQRKRVFWLAYILDKDTCLRSGRPTAQDDDDMNVELPSEDPPDNVGNIPLADGKGKVNLFRLMCEFATISSRVYKRLYSVEASKQSDGELLNTIGDLDKELEDWKDKIPIDFRPEHEIKASHTPLVVHIVVLHFSYYNCLATIHRMSVHHGYWTSRLADYAISGLNAKPLNPRVFSSAALCVQAARASIHLIKYIPQSDFACVWLVIYFPVSALVTIFANILQNPQDARARTDVKLMDLVVNFLSNVTAEEGTGSFKRMWAVCSEFTRIARLCLDKAEKEGMKRKRKMLPEEQQSLAAGQRAMAQAQALAQNMARPMTPPKSRASVGGSALGSSNTSNMAAQRSPQSGLGNQQRFTAETPTSTTGFPLSNYAETFTTAPSMDASFLGNAPSTTMSPGAFGTSFQQPFVPQDLWQMPMTFEWDIWTDLNNQGYQNLDGNDAMLNNGNNMQ